MTDKLAACVFPRNMEIFDLTTLRGEAKMKPILFCLPDQPVFAKLVPT